MISRNFNGQRSAAVMLSLLACLVTGLVASAPVAYAEKCVTVGGELMTNIGAIAGQTNLGPVFGDLSGSVAATILGQNSNGTYNVQHYWVTSAGDTILMKQAVLTPTYPLASDQAVVAVPWGYYGSDIDGGTGKFEGATGHLDYFGIADFNENTLVLRYKGWVCYAH